MKTRHIGDAVGDRETGEIVETPLAAFRRSAGFQFMFVLHSGMEVGKAIDHLCASAQKFGAAMREWQPIDTVPKDGTEVLLVWQWDSGIHKGTSVVLAAWRCRAHSHLSMDTDCPNEPGCDMNWDAYGGRMTHWMPLPGPPSLSISDRPDDGQASESESV